MRKFAFILALAAWLWSSSAYADEVRRFALLVGVNDGGAERSQLRFAESDAKAVGAVLVEMGGVARTDEVYALNTNLAGLQKALDRVEKLLTTAREAGTRLELVIYYSGHSDEKGLLLGEARYPYDDFRARIESMPADVRIVVVDSCASGALIRPKGGRSRPSFLIDLSNSVRGQAIVTSSSIDEAAQESDDLGASYFTHFLVSGLRGAADRNSDSRVTLSEAYSFAFNNTLQVTNSSASGPQHPTYDFQLMGHGELVLTAFTPRTATLELGPDIVGRVYVWNQAERLAAEAPKLFGAVTELGLSPGRYVVTVRHDGALRRADIELPRMGRRRLTAADFSREALVATRTRGTQETEPEGTATVRRGGTARMLLPSAAILTGLGAGFLIAGDVVRSRGDDAVATVFDYQSEMQWDQAATAYGDGTRLYRNASRLRLIGFTSLGLGVGLLALDLFLPRRQPVAVSIGPSHVSAAVHF